MEPRRDVLPTIFAFALIYVVWGSSFLAIRFAVETLPPLLMMGTRHLAAGGLLLAWQFARGKPFPEPRLWRHAFIAGAFCFLGCHGLLAWAELRISSGLAALLSATLPIWMILLARMHGQGSELTARVLSGIGLGLVGVGVLIPFSTEGHPLESWSALSIIVCEMLWAASARCCGQPERSTPAVSRRPPRQPRLQPCKCSPAVCFYGSSAWVSVRRRM